MTRISRKLKTDKRTLSVIKADVLKTKIYLQYNNMTLTLSSVDAQRIGDTLQKAVAIQKTNRQDTHLLTPTFLQPLVQPQVIIQPLVPLSTLEKNLELCRYVYQVIKNHHPDIPKYRKTRIMLFSPKICNSDSMGTAFAHAHNSGRMKNKICIKQKYLIDPLRTRQRAKFQLLTTNMQDLYENIGDMMAHEIAHLTITGCSHCKIWYARYKKLHHTIMIAIRNGEYLATLPVELLT